MPKILITGFNGFVGHHAVNEFRDRGYEVHGISFSKIDKEAEHSVDRTYVCDLSNPRAVAKLDIDPSIDAVLNLAGIATNTGGDADIIRSVNVGVHVNMCKLLGSLSISPIYLGVSSSTVYSTNQKLPLTEESELKNKSDARPYEASKIEAEEELKKFNDLNIVIARPFNHIGPGQGPGFLIPDLAKEILKSRISGSPVMVGNLSSKRDYTNVKDVVKAYADIVEMKSFNKCEIFNICSGKSISGQEILSMLIRAMGLEREISCEVDPGKLRGAGDIEDNYGSYEKLNKATGWNPSIDGVVNAITEFAEDFLDKNV